MTYATAPVVVGVDVDVDGSAAAMEAARWAARSRPEVGAPLELINGMPGAGRQLAGDVTNVAAKNLEAMVPKNAADGT